MLHYNNKLAVKIIDTWDCIKIKKKNDRLKITAKYYIVDWFVSMFLLYFLFEMLFTIHRLSIFIVTGLQTIFYFTTFYYISLVYKIILFQWSQKRSISSLGLYQSTYIISASLYYIKLTYSTSTKKPINHFNIQNNDRNEKLWRLPFWIVIKTRFSYFHSATNTDYSKKTCFRSKI